MFSWFKNLQIFDIMSSKKKLLVNMSSIGQQLTGLGVYSEKCAECLEQNFPVHILTSFYKPLNSSEVIKSPKEISIKNNKYSAILRLIYSFSGLFKRDYYVYNPTHSGFFFIKNQILTIHDLICINYPAQHKFQYLYFKYFIPLLIHSSNAIFTVSNSSKAELLNHYGTYLKEKKINVVYNGVDLDVFNPINPCLIKNSQGLNSSQKFLLAVGAAFSHKNLHEILENHHLWSDTCILKIVGSSGDYKKFLFEYAEKLGILSSVEFLGYVEISELVNLYRSCEALIYPSLCEGFGIPPLEAMACGAPVIVSDLDVHKEILSSVPLYITPSNKESWAAAFLTLFNERSTIESKIAYGLEHVKSFTWELSCNQLVTSIIETFPELNKNLL